MGAWSRNASTCRVERMRCAVGRVGFGVDVVGLGVGRGGVADGGEEGGRGV